MYRLALLLIPVICLVPVADAQIYVHQGGLGDALTIQGGIDLCPDGGTVVVAAGTYSGDGNRHLSIEQGIDLVLSSEGGAEVTTIDATGGGYCFYLTNQQSPSTVIDGFTVTGANGCNGGGMSIYMSSPTIRNCIFRDNRATYGGTSLGAGIYYMPAGEGATIENCQFIDNIASSGGALYLIGSNGPSIIDCEFRGNRAYQKGGAIFVTNSYPGPIEDCHFYENQAVSGGGIYFQWTCPTTVSNCTFSRNNATSAGGGIYIHGTQPLIEQCVIAFSVHGGSIFCNTGSWLTVERCLFFGNEGGDEPCPDGLRSHLVLDPQFCGIPEDGNCRLQSDSPCLPENNEYDVLIGAWPVGCGDTVTRSITWSGVKSLY